MQNQMDLGDVYAYPPPNYLLQNVVLDPAGTSLLNGLKGLIPDQLASGIEALRQNTAKFQMQDRLGNTLYIRSFYSRLRYCTGIRKFYLDRESWYFKIMVPTIHVVSLC